MMDKLLIFLMCFYFASAMIKIKELKVPHSLKSGSENDVLLDCIFETDNEEGVEIKWFYNGPYEQIYQWIPGSNDHGYASGTKHKDNIDVHYKVTDDAKTMYRALYIKDISPEFSGNYTCKVSGYVTEDSMTKTMTIYDPADDGLNVYVNDNTSVVLCTSEGLYPKPEMFLYISNDNESEVFGQQKDEETHIDLDDYGFYNVSAVLYLKDSNISNTFVYICELRIPGTDYVIKEKKSYTLVFDTTEEPESEDYLSVFHDTSNFLEIDIDGVSNLNNTSNVTYSTESPTESPEDDQASSSVTLQWSLWAISTCLVVLLARLLDP